MGRHPTGKVPNQPLRIIMGKHREIMRRVIAGEKQRRIALEMGMSEARLSVICNSPLFKRELEGLQKQVNDRFVDVSANIQEKVKNKINGLQESAVDVLGKILNDSSINEMKVSPLLKKDTALSILELGGNGKKRLEEQHDAMHDVVEIIKQGFDLAKAAIKDRDNREVAEIQPIYEAECSVIEDTDEVEKLQQAI